MSISIKVLGTGCTKCKKAIAAVEEYVNENNIDATVEKVEDILEIMKYNVMSTPAVVVNEEVRIKGKIPNKSELEQALSL